ncbi:MAG: gamma-glutamyltransferase, partial [Xanthobacteraceae bacterium]
MLNIRIGKFSRLACAVLFGMLAVTLLANAEDRKPALAPADGRLAAPREVIGNNGMVVAQDAAAARVGVAILRNGGNAVDAAVAVGFALAASYPRAGNI